MKTVRKVLKNLPPQHYNIITEKLLLDIVENLDNLNLEVLRQFVDEQLKPKPIKNSFEANRGYTLGKTEFLGVQCIDKDGNKELTVPFDNVKDYVEKYFNERNSITTSFTK